MADLFLEKQRQKGAGEREGKKEESRRAREAEETKEKIHFRKPCFS